MKTLLSALLLLAPGLASADLVPVRGDAVQGEQLFRMECAPCHGIDARGADFWRKASHGKGLGELPDLRDSAYLAQASDAQLRRAIRKGMGRNGWIPGHAFGGTVTSLQSWDIVQWLRDGNLGVAQFYPAAVKFTAKEFQLDEFGLKRLKEAIGLELPREQQAVVILTVYKGKRSRSRNVRLVPWKPVELDLLKAEDRLGFLAFVKLLLPGEKSAVPAGIAIGKDGKIEEIALKLDDPKKRAEHEKALRAFIGQGEKKAVKLKVPKGLKNGDKYEAVLTRAVARAAEGIVMYDKAERERTAFDQK